MTLRKKTPENKMSLVQKTALNLFVQKGYHNVSIPTIVKASGVSTGAIYSYFKNKEALGQSIYNQILDRFNQDFSARLEEKTETYDKLRAFVELVFNYTEQDPIVMEYMLFMRHAEFLHECTPICHSEPFKVVRQILWEGMQRQDVKQQDDFVAGISFTGVILRAVELRLADVYRHSLTENIEIFMENAWCAVKYRHSE